MPKSGRKQGNSPSALTGLPSYLLTRIAHRYTQNTHLELKAIGLTTIATRIVVTLKIFGELTVKELCVHAIAEQPTMSRALDRMEIDGLIQRRVGEEDSRSRVLCLTEAGEKLFERIWPVMVNANEDMLEGIWTDRETTMKTLLHILQNIRKHPI